MRIKPKNPKVLRARRFIVGGVALAAVLFVLLRPALRQRARAVGTGCLAMGALALFLCSDWFPWQALKQLPLVYDLFSKQQFAWRGLTVVCLCLTVPTALALDHLWQRRGGGGGGAGLFQRSECVQRLSERKLDADDQQLLPMVAGYPQRRRVYAHRR